MCRPHASPTPRPALGNTAAAAVATTSSGGRNLRSRNAARKAADASDESRPLRSAIARTKAILERALHVWMRTAKRDALAVLAAHACFARTLRRARIAVAAAGCARPFDWYDRRVWRARLTVRAIGATICKTRARVRRELQTWRSHAVQGATDAR